MTAVLPAGRTDGTPRVAGSRGRYRAARPLPTGGRRRGPVRLLAAAGAVLLLAGGALLVAGSQPLRTSDGAVSATVSSAALDLAQDRPVRQVQYTDRTTLAYTMTLHNSGVLPVVLSGVTPTPDERTTLMHLEDLRLVLPGGENAPVDGTRLWPGDEVEVMLAIEFSDCEDIGARSSSLLSAVEVRMTLAGFDRRQSVDLPEILRTGSPREAGCPRATAGSRAPG